ncbi:MAG TPA: EAL domain-containing protein [Acidimicrobiales bacterium]|nr:EAL domain-containing protein [Acidimicrobiales bacterium]
MSLPLRAKAVIGAAGMAGLVASGFAAHGLTQISTPSFKVLAVLSVFGVLWVTSWLWPLVMYREQQSETMHVDEGFFIVLVLLAPASAAVATVAVATVLAQAFRRRPIVKSVFNCGQMMAAVWMGTVVFGTLGHSGTNLTPRDIAAAVAGALAFFVVNSVAMASILGATGASWRKALFDGIEVRMLLSGGCIAVAIPAALVVASYGWALPLAVVPLVFLRQVLAGHFEARHDRARLRGLFEATLEINRTMGTDETTDAILHSAKELLRCNDAKLTDRADTDGSLGAPLSLTDDPLLLSVSGRSRAEPFDNADQALLDALAAVGATALTNAALYQEGRQQRERLSAITSSLGEGVCAVDRSGQITFMNPAAADMLGWHADRELRGHELESGLDFGGVRAPSFILAPALRAMAKVDTITNYDTRFTRGDGTTFHVAFTVSPIMDSGAATGAVLVFRDITERKEFEEQLARHAFHDALTGLPNRRLFLDHLDHALRRSQRSEEVHAVLFADVDRFKIINDSLGHHAGDQLLIAIADRLKTAVRPGDMLARFGGDEFTLLLEAVATPEDSVACAQRILDRMREPIALPDGHEVVATVSIGIALTSPDMSRDDVLHDADVAMYQAKAKGRGGYYEVFDVDAMGVRSAERIDLEAGLRHALERDELVVYYQPLVSTVDGQVVGAEALVRWQHPTRGLLAPAHFIGLAEDTGLILPLGRIVLDRACRQAREWRQRFGVALSVCVNLSARQFQQAGLVEEVEEVLVSTGVDPSQMCLEITESLAMEDAERTSQILMRLRSLGVKVAIDDFGTGYSALGYLATFPVDVVKVDQSFVEKIDIDPVKSAIVSAVINLSAAIGTTTVVEGVETKEQLDHLRSIGCSIAQGYYFARPMPAATLTSVLQTSMSLMDHDGVPRSMEVAVRVA